MKGQVIPEILSDDVGKLLQPQLLVHNTTYQTGDKSKLVWMGQLRFREMTIPHSRNESGPMSHIYRTERILA